MFMTGGQLTFAGDVPSVIERYMASFAKADSRRVDPARRPGTGELRFTSVTANKEYFECGEEKAVSFTIERFKPIEGKFFVSCHVVDPQGFTILHCDSRMLGKVFDAADRIDGEFFVRTPWLKPGSYRLDFFVCSAGVLDRFEEACSLFVIPLLPYPAAGNEEAMANGVVFSDFRYVNASDKPAGSLTCTSVIHAGVI
jgi:lipopolysaccharide transport system ATP-binding protein